MGTGPSAGLYSCRTGEMGDAGVDGEMGEVDRVGKGEYRDIGDAVADGSAMNVCGRSVRCAELGGVDSGSGGVDMNP